MKPHHRPLVSTLVFTLLLGLTATVLQAQTAPVDVKSVKFSALPDSTIQAEVELNVGRNPRKDAPSDRFVDDVEVTLTLAFPFRGTKDYAFYRAKVNIASLETGKKKVVHFFLPGVIADRDRLGKSTDLYVVQLKVAGEQIPMGPSLVASKLSNPRDAEGFLSKADEGVRSTEGILLSFPLAPAYLQMNSTIKPVDIPFYIRKEGATW